MNNEKVQNATHHSAPEFPSLWRSVWAPIGVWVWGLLNWDAGRRLLTILLCCLAVAMFMLGGGIALISAFPATWEWWIKPKQDERRRARSNNESEAAGDDLSPGRHCRSARLACSRPSDFIVTRRNVA